MRYRDRGEAGRTLAVHVRRALRPDPTPGGSTPGAGPLVLALPRGGVPVAAEVATALHAELDVLVVRKLGMPGHEEYAMGALAPGGVQVVDEAALALGGVDPDRLAHVVQTERAELERRERRYRPGREPPRVRGRTVVLVDDGIATGASMRAAVMALFAMARDDAPAGAAPGDEGPDADVVVAVPVAPPDALDQVRALGARTVCPLVVPALGAVGSWYDDFHQLDDGEVRACLSRAAHATGGTGAG